MTAKPVIPTRQARQDVEDELTHHLVDEGSEQAALGFIAEMEHAYAHLASPPPTSALPVMGTSSTYPVCAHGLSIATRI